MMEIMVPIECYVIGGNKRLIYKYAVIEEGVKDGHHWEWEILYKTISEPHGRKEDRATRIPNAYNITGI